MRQTLSNKTGKTIALVAVGLLAATTSQADEVAAELKAYWSVISDAARTGNFEAMAAGYHPDAVLVSEYRGKTLPIKEALAIWKLGIEATRNGEMSANVEFRITEQLNDATTAHQVGIFRYESSQPGSEPEVQYVHFEALFVKQDGWKMLMERQKHAATEAEWDAALKQ